MISTPEKYRRRVQVPEMPETMTEQHHAPDAHLPSIMIKYRRTGVLPVASKVAQFGDFTRNQTYQETQNILAEARSTFESMKPEVRAEFGNDVAQFLDELNDPDMAEKLDALGFEVAYLKTEEEPETHPEPPEPPERPVTDDPPSPPPEPAE